MQWLITDTHFSDPVTAKMCNWPDNYEEMICDNWNDMVKPNDIVYHLGDAAFTDEAQRKLLSLPGKKCLILGNHDIESPDYYLSLGWNCVCTQMIILASCPEYYWFHILLSHTEQQWPFDANVNIHGHYHDLHRENFNQLVWPLSIEHMGFKPIALDDEFIKYIEGWFLERNNPSTADIWRFRQNYKSLDINRDFYGVGLWNKSIKSYERKLKFINDIYKCHEQYKSNGINSIIREMNKEEDVK